jgi:selenocysteine-specific translation elongation factor
MKNLNIGIFHDETLGGELAKKGTLSDIAMFNRKAGDNIYTFMAPVGDKLAAKSQIMSGIDVAVVSLASLTPDVGETILMLDAMGISKGIAVIPPDVDLKPIMAITKGTTLESFKMTHRDPPHIMQDLEAMESVRDSAVPVSVVVDHSFSVKGVGEVVLAIVASGTVKKHSKLQLMPLGREVEIRSIQMQDKDFDEAPAGSRVGLCIKGATAEEMRRGAVICARGAAKAAQEIKLDFRKNKFYPALAEGMFHVTVGMQTVPVKLSVHSESSVTIKADKPIAYSPEDVFLLLDLNAKKLHLLGSGRAVSSV